MTDDRLSGKVAVVTQATQGVGPTIAIALGAAGAAVAVNYRDNELEARRLVDHISDLGGRAAAVRANLEDRAEVDEMFHQILEEFRVIDVLVTVVPAVALDDFLTMPHEVWEERQALDLKSTFLCAVAAARIMVHQHRGGRIIAVCPTRAPVLRPRRMDYASTSAGVRSFIESLAVVLGAEGITCNWIAAGGPEHGRVGTRGSDPATGHRSDALSELAYSDDFQDLAAPVLFFASDGAQHVSGTGLVVDRVAPA